MRQGEAAKMIPVGFYSPRHDNLPERFELFLLQDGERKIQEEIYASMANCSEFKIIKEDHTIANLLVAYLRKHENHGGEEEKEKEKPSHLVLTAWAKPPVPHPNVPELFIRLQTDGSITPKEAFVQASQRIIGMLGQLDRNFTREFELRRMVSAGDHGNEGGKEREDPSSTVDNSDGGECEAQSSTTGMDEGKGY
ncbi:hypothetical protein MKZ38_008957 [Zalerion maritima]|uniref:DNA-directed RNA polymerase RBP11-like dimerisation domain-containing protein n=1 Tax=Zalerion maritima TaxID=339359 RepID=A0AAD5WUY1_9PEZI|nr:hypothetical protein MKZ38_008957 [Zalerion maritima]